MMLFSLYKAWLLLFLLLLFSSQGIMIHQRKDVTKNSISQKYTSQQLVGVCFLILYTCISLCSSQFIPSPSPAPSTLCISFPIFFGQIQFFHQLGPKTLGTKVLLLYKIFTKYSSSISRPQNIWDQVLLLYNCSISLQVSTPILCKIALSRALYTHTHNLLYKIQNCHSPQIDPHTTIKLLLYYYISHTYANNANLSKEKPFGLASNQ